MPLNWGIKITSTVSALHISPLSLRKRCCCAKHYAVNTVCTSYSQWSQQGLTRWWCKLYPWDMFCWYHKFHITQSVLDELELVIWHLKFDSCQRKRCYRISSFHLGVYETTTAPAMTTPQIYDLIGRMRENNRFPDSASYVGWICWLSSLLWEVFPRILRFSPLHFIKFDLY